MVLVAKSLRKAMVPSSLIDLPSPANLQSTRFALHVNGDDPSSCLAYLASGCSVYNVQMSLERCWVASGKEGLLIPEHSMIMDSSSVNRCPHRAEIQSIRVAETEDAGFFVLGSVDSHGHLIISKIDANGCGYYRNLFSGAFSCMSCTDVEDFTFSVLPQDHGVGEGGWAGLCFNPMQWSIIAVARSFPRCIDVYDQDLHLQTLRTLWYPTSLNFVQNLSNGMESSILAVAEGCQLTIWDFRMKDNGGCLHRICGSPGDSFYAVCSSSTGYIAVGGADRTVSIYDPRRWSALSRWRHCSKYEITGLAFSSADPDHIFIQGVDYEVFCGQWKECKRVLSFKGDSNWLGFSKCPGRDVVGGWCDSGSVFVADVVTDGVHENCRESLPAAG